MRGSVKGVEGLEAQRLVVVRGGRRLLDDASLAVTCGAIATIEGPSGSGKSTLLRAIATLIPVEGGRVLLDGADVATMAPTDLRRRVAYVPQQPPMLEGSVAANVAVGPRLAGRAMDPAAIAALLARVGLPAAFADRDAKSLSGGERQRLALARALANEPRVLLLDEPTSALDPEAADRVLDLVRALATEGLAIVVVTHVRAHAARLGGERWICRAGRLDRGEAHDQARGGDG
jgi:putative ABC transport system ATP-binding protein